MKRKGALVILALALALASLVPAMTVLAKPGSEVVAQGNITYVAPTELGEMVYAAGDSGRWRVVDRAVGGIFNGPGIVGDFAFTYKANVAASQAGKLHGTLNAAQYVINVNGTAEAATFFGYYGPYPLYEIKLGGNWTVLDGAKGNGDFTANIVFIPSADGAHIAFIIPEYSVITLTGSLVP
ncbi:MAG: hypothetical protein PHN78_04210 [Dehalococcoidales bacterium]|nr:hypothetical protein [Dehalococcoidales bacterium]